MHTMPIDLCTAGISCDVQEIGCWWLWLSGKRMREAPLGAKGGGGGKGGVGVGKKGGKKGGSKKGGGGKKGGGKGR